MNNNELTLSQAHKLYTGDGIWLRALMLSIGIILMYSATILTFFLIMLLSEGNVKDAVKEIDGVLLTNIFLTVDTGTILMISGLMQYDKLFPGGKYFRSVKGGFGTYRKMKNASLIARIVSLTAVMLFGAAMDMLGVLKLANGAGDAVYIGAFLLIAAGLINFMNLVRNQALRGFLTPFIIMAAGMLGVMLPRLLDGDIRIALAIAAAAVPFVLISQAVMLNNYKRHKWD